MCLTCQFKVGSQQAMVEVAQGMYVCEVCKTTKCTTHAAPVLLSRAGIAATLDSLKGILFVGGFTLLLLCTVLFTAYPRLEVSATWGALSSLYLIYFGLAMVNFRRKLYA